MKRPKKKLLADFMACKIYKVGDIVRRTGAGKYNGYYKIIEASGGWARGEKQT